MSASAAIAGAAIDRMTAAAKSLIFIVRPRIRPVVFRSSWVRTALVPEGRVLSRPPVFPKPATRATQSRRDIGGFPAGRVQISTDRGHKSDLGIDDELERG